MNWLFEDPALFNYVQGAKCIQGGWLKDFNDLSDC